jgi:hypothetical protein
MMRALIVATLVLSGCGGTTGSGLVNFAGWAGGPVEASAPIVFETGLSYRVELTRARLHVAAVYLNQSVPSSGAQQSSCILPGIYVAQIFGPLDLDLLSSGLVPFSLPGEGTQTAARTGEVWLTGGPIDALDDPTVILDVAGTASKGGADFPFESTVTIGQNRAIPVQNPATPGSNPICHERIVTPIAIDLTPTDGGQLTLRIDPRGMFHGVEFADAEKVSDTPPFYRIPDENGGVGGALFKGLLSNAGVYSLTFSPEGVN